MRPWFASVYIAALADTMASHNSLSPTTDDPRIHSAFEAIDQLADILVGESYAPPQDDITGAYIHLALQSVLEPTNIADVSIDKLVKFRQRHLAGLRAFWTHVAGLGDELAHASSVDNTELMYIHLKDIYDSQTKPLLLDLKRGLSSYGIDTVAGSMALKVNVTAASGTALGAAALDEACYVLLASAQYRHLA
jgi:hypothetical protein